MRAKIKKLKNTAVVPTKAYDEAAGMDLYACMDNAIVTIKPHETVKIGTGISVELPHHTFGAVMARSGIATKQGLRPANCVGVVDSDYRGEIIVALHNDTDINQSVVNCSRIAQLVVVPYTVCELDVVEELSETTRGSNGFGSSGK